MAHKKREEERLLVAKELSDLKYQYERDREELRNVSDSLGQLKNNKLLEGRSLKEAITLKENEIEVLKGRVEREAKEKQEMSDRMRSDSQAHSKVVAEYKQKLKSYQEHLEGLQK